MDYTALKNEIALPAYNGMPDTQIAIAVSAKTVIAPTAAVIPIEKVVNCFDAVELLAMPANQLSALNLMLRGVFLDVTTNSSLRALLTAVFLDKPNSLAKLVALVQQYDNATVGWTVFNLGVPSVSALDVTAARLH